MIVIDDRVASIEHDTLFGSAVGTTVPVLHFKPRKLFLGVCMLGCVASGTLAAISPTDAFDLNNVVAEASTLPVVLSPPGKMVDPATVTVVLQRLRTNSGLTWGDISHALGVTRRTVHNWLSGSRVAGVHLSRLLEFDRLVNSFALGHPDETRAMLLQPRSNGRSILDEMALTARPARRLPLSSVSVADQIGPTSDEPDLPPTGQLRRSAIRGGPLPRRRSDET